ncbi:uncharacterized protein LOC126843716 [Adelges cooleyi]|uniref:uncharacterized protein LOC126843716 n=1 Tax=Adelges cooleyi TaxID=133065 RepID=UPI00218062C9|nr:uncharacterized protein LOC126843716 [Adelges cooleyi]
MLLYVNLVSVAVYAQLAWCIGRRFDIINSEIEAKLERLPSTNRVEFPNRQHHNLSYLLRCSNNLTKDVKFIPIKTYQEIYWNLCYSVNILNRHYGWILLTGLLMTIIRLILIPNILITNVLNTKLHGSQNYGFTISLVGWVICHLSFLFLMVLPSSYAASRAETTAVIVCRHLNGYFVPDDIKRLELFVLQLHKHKVHFSICGIVDLQRSTITKVIGTIISYLLIFIQMQNK